MNEKKIGTELDYEVINTMRSLSLDMVQNANNGHLGTALGAMPAAYVLYKNHMNVNPSNPDWFNRDRFILSAGHASPLIYSILHVFGFDLTIEDLKKFRQVPSKTPGHPEYGRTPGIDVSTGPLGQGFATSVGLAIAEKHLRQKYNKEDLEIVNHKTYVLCGDGDLMEGVALETASIAGHLGLSNLIVIFDSNDICSDGSPEDSSSDDIKMKFESMGWKYLKVEDGNNLEELDNAITEAKKSKNKPVIIESKSIIGYGSKFAKTSSIHSDAIGEEETKNTKLQLGWNYEELFYIPDLVKEFKEEYVKQGQEKENKWNDIKEKYKNNYPEDYDNLFNVDKFVDKFNTEDIDHYKEPVSTRDASGRALNHIFDKKEFLVGGSADLASSNRTTLKNSGFMTSDDCSVNNIHFGVREFGMATITNGITLHGSLQGYCGTFLVFLDYMKAALRMAALMEINPVYIYTHDSLVVGPDGPTHQPVEQLATLRSTPGIDVIRPADGNETIYAWEYALKNDKPTVLVLSRQALEIVEGTSYENLTKGAYLLTNDDQAEGTIIATGSEVSLALLAKARLKEEGIVVNVVNMPSWEIFEKQSEEYKNKVIDRTKKVLSVEAGSSFGWAKYADNFLSIDTFGDSATGDYMYREYGFTVENVVNSYKEI